MRIAFFTDVYEPTINGVVASINLYAEQLRKLGHEVIIICPRYDDEKDGTDPNVVRIRSFTFKRYDEYRVALPFSLFLESHMRNNIYDIIHIHSPFSIGIAGVVYGRRYGVPVVYTAHTNYADYRHYVRGGWVIPKGAIHKIESLFSNRLHTTIAPSKKIADSLRKYGTHKSIEVLPTGIKYSRKTGSRSSFKKKFGIGRNKVALYTGRLTKEKNIEFILKSFAIAKKNGLKSTKLVFVGDGPFADDLRVRAQEMNVEDDTIFTGFQTGQDLLDAYASATIFCHASHSETQGLTLLEACSHGIPLLVCRDDAYDGIARNGYNAIVVGGDEDEYARKMISFLNGMTSKELTRYSKNSRTIARAFTIDQQAVQLIDIYKSTIQNHRAEILHEE